MTGRKKYFCPNKTSSTGVIFFPPCIRKELFYYSIHSVLDLLFIIAYQAPLFPSNANYQLGIIDLLLKKKIETGNENLFQSVVFFSDWRNGPD